MCPWDVAGGGNSCWLESAIWISYITERPCVGFRWNHFKGCFVDSGEAFSFFSLSLYLSNFLVQ
jgi:hypothetical protein